MVVLRRMILGLCLTVAFSSPVSALCGDTSGDDQVTATDALAILNTAVGLQLALNCSCDACGSSVVSETSLDHCADVSGDSAITAVDALMTLSAAVGQPVPLNCSCEACEVSTTSTITSSTTTTTLSGCPSPAALDDRTYVEKYTCVESYPGGEPFCADSNASDSIKFDHLGGGSYEVRDVPPTGFVYNGTLTCRTFDWEALNPGTYTESGTWIFSNDLSSFSGSSTYGALDESFEGACNGTGAESPGVPPDPAPIPPCK